MDYIPSHWKGNPLSKTRTALLQKRKEQNYPHPSFDLDGDGVVGGQDYLISKKCDLDRDGILNSTQSQLAQKLRQTNNFFWGCESSGVNRSYRIVQKRGKTVFSEDFTTLQQTYPIIERLPQKINTFDDIKERRKQQTINTGKIFQQKLQTDFQLDLPAEKLIKISKSSPSPKYRSLSQKRSQAYKRRRIFNGLSETPLQVSFKGNVSLEYKVSPRFSCKSAMIEARKKEIMKNLTQAVNFNHQLDQQRLKKRQEKYMWNDIQGLTNKEIRNRRITADFQHNSEIFANRPIGVHGTELPSFSKYKPEYWNKQTTLQQSRRKLLHNRKKMQVLYRENPQLLVLNDGELTPLPFDKQYVAVKRQQRPISLKPNLNAFVLYRKQKYMPKQTEFSSQLTQYLKLKKSNLARENSEVPQSVPSTTKEVFFPKRRLSRTPIATKLAERNQSQSPPKGSPVRTCAFNN